MQTTTAHTRKTSKIVAEICLYGVQAIGYAFLASAPTVTGTTAIIAGDYEPEARPLASESLTLAIWKAAEAVRATGIRKGTVRIFAPGGERYADVDLAGHVPNAGSIRWTSV